MIEPTAADLGNPICEGDQIAMPTILPFLVPAACVVASYLLGVRRRSRLAELHLESRAARHRAQAGQP